VEWPEKYAAELWLILFRKGRKGVELLKEQINPLLILSFLGKSKKYYTFSTHIVKDSFFFISNAYKKAQITGGRIFSSAGQQFRTDPDTGMPMQDPSCPYCWSWTGIHPASLYTAVVVLNLLCYVQVIIK
jgi:hypothetical protein